MSVIDTTTSPPTAVRTVPVHGSPQQVAVGPNGRYAYTADLNSNQLDVISLAQRAVVTPIRTGSPDAVALTADGRDAYVAHLYSNMVSIIPVPPR